MLVDLDNTCFVDAKGAEIHSQRRRRHQHPKRALDSRTRTRTSTRFDCSFLAKILEKFITDDLSYFLLAV